MIVLTGGSRAVNGVIQLIVVIIMFLFVLALAYLAARLAGRFQSNIQSQSNIRILEVARISNNKYIQIVKIGQRYYAVGVGKEEVNLIAELQEEDLNLKTTTEGTKAVLPGIWRRWTQVRAASGGQMQLVWQLLERSSKGVMGGSCE